MKKCLGSLILVCLFLQGTAQESEPALARVHYEFFHINDTLNPDKPAQEELVLYLGQTSTLYGSYEFNRILQNIEKQMNDAAFDGNLTIMTSRGYSSSSYYTQLHHHQFKQIYQSQGAHYLVDEHFPEIDWVIGDESREIGGYQAQQATGWFGGREYVAWFTTELPFQGGPWKLQGLPGLILDAASSDGEVRFSYAGLETVIEGEAQIGIPAQAIPTSPRALERLQEAIRKNPQAAMNARGAANQPSGGAGSNPSGRGGVITFSSGGNPLANPNLDASRIKSISVRRDGSARSEVTNNPLELKK